MGAFTPGPWKAEQTLNEWCITGQDRDDDPHSGTVVFSDAGVNGEANALLIAAAPDLLKAAIQAYDALNELLGADYDVAGDMALLRTAINEALGKGRDDEPPYPTE